MTIFLSDNFQFFITNRVSRQYLKPQIVFALLGASAQAYSADHYVDANSNGGDGSDWANTYSTLPSSLIRGDTYYIADGSYGVYNFNDPESGSRDIIIKKATQADHGTDTGWLSTMGDGQATFNSTLTFSSDNYVFDGQIRNEADWFDGDSYGFKIVHNSRDQNIVVQASNVTVQNVFVDALVSLPENTIRRYAVDTDSYGGPIWTGLVFRRMYVYGSNNIWFLRTTNGALVEFSASENAQSNGANHGEIWNSYFSVNNEVIRYNIVRNAYNGSPGTAIVAKNEGSGLEFYGNLIYDFETTDGIVGFSGGSARNSKVYNNTIVNGNSWNQGVRLEGPNNIVRNNLWINCQAVNIDLGSGSTNSHNGFSTGSTSGSNAQGDVTTSIFVNYPGKDFRLSRETNGGVILPAPYDKDMFGQTRGVDAVVSRGAFEYFQGNAARPDPPSDLSVN